MPEFAEVNKQVMWLRERVTGWEITEYGTKGQSHFPELKDDPRRDDVLRGFFVGARIEAVTQRGKFVVFRLSTGTMTAHLMFKGRWSVAGDDFTSNYKAHKEKPTPASNNFWAVSPGGRLNFHEPESMGKVHAYPGKAPGEVDELAALGPEVLVTPETDPDFAAEWTADHLRATAGKSKVAIKAFLLDQKRQAGMGNMYVCEALYRARIDPGRPANSLSDAEVTTLHGEAQAVIRLSIETGLDYGQVLQVYRKETDPKGHSVECSQVGGRDTFWVPAVQK